MTVEEVKNEIAKGSRVLLLVRHAERPHIDHEDPSFGGDLALTAEGCRTARELGRMLAGCTAEVDFRASPLNRTVMTAELIAEGMGLGGAEVVRDAEIGNGGAFMADEREVFELFRDGRFFEKMRDYLEHGIQRGFAPLAAAADLYERHALGVFEKRLGIFTTHDIFVAAFLHARGVKTDFCEANWPRFLDTAAIIVDPNGSRRYAFVEPKLSVLACGVASTALHAKSKRNK